MDPTPPVESPAAPSSGERGSTPGRGWVFGAVLLLVLGAAAFGFFPGAFRKTSAPPGAPPAPMLPAREDTAGEVTVTVTPKNIVADASAWEFAVAFNTHSVDLTEDFAAASVLVDDAGREWRARAWVGDPPGGHHRTGKLQFSPLVPVPRAITLKLRQVGGVAERTFVWVITP